MRSQLPVFSPDTACAAAVVRALNTESPGGEAFDDAPLMLEYIREFQPPTLLVDLRNGLDHTATCRLLDGLLERPVAALNVVTFGDNGLPREAAVAADLLAAHHVIVGHDVAASLSADEELQSYIAGRRPRPLPERRVLSADDVQLATYTPEFFGVVDDLVRVAHRDVTLLLVGETGTGKTTLARFVHQRSSRADRPFQNLACGALPNDLIESELFGHIRGAFTGADRNKIGRFEAAGRGTLLLDEIDVLDPKQQAKLLKVIETGEYEMVGSTESRHSEARLIVASNVNLEDLMRKSQFRSDLYYRLNVLEFRLPPLRDRPLDIVPLALGFADEFCREHQIAIRRVQRDFLEALRRHRWPGNLRELKNHIRRAVLFCEGDELTVNDLSASVVRSQLEPQTNGRETERGWSLADRIARSERDLLEQALKANGHNRTRTAKALGISRVGLYKKLRRLGLAAERPKVDAS